VNTILRNSIFVALLGACVLARNASAGTYANITIDGSFSDWGSVPVAYTDASGDGSPTDLATIQIANDANNLYLRLTYYTAVNPQAGSGIFLAIDNDNNTATGFDVFGLGLVGAEAGWQNDFPFAQSNGVFNTGGGLTGAAALISPYNTVTTEQEYSISRSATFTATGTPVFPGDTFTLLEYTVDGTADVAGPVQYTFATVPEPGTLTLVGFGLLTVVGLVRSRRSHR
jgi:PEP-CTERM motif